MKYILKGMGVSEGRIRGRVKIIEKFDDLDRFKEGDILVTHITDPTMVAQISQAAAIVCDIGGMTSHPSIISREMGIPCVVNTKEGTTKLSDGMMIMVDGSNGEICEI